MTYNDWKDELLHNLMGVPDEERRRVLDFYAEAYADKRESGMSESDIIRDFGAPYDAAQRVLNEMDAQPAATDGQPFEEFAGSKQQSSNPAPPAAVPAANSSAGNTSAPNTAPAGKTATPEAKTRKDYSWMFWLLCGINALPLFLGVLGLAIASFIICLAPVATFAGGIMFIIASFVRFASGMAAYGALQLGIGLTMTGVGIILCPILFNVAQMLWVVFVRLFKKIERIFSGEKANEIRR